MDPVTLRPVRAEDDAALARLYAEAFPDEDLMPLVAALHRLPGCCLSVVAVASPVVPDLVVPGPAVPGPVVPGPVVPGPVVPDPAVIGHGMFTDGSVAGSGGSVALLGPLAVAAGRRRQGIGRRLVAFGLDDLRRRAVAMVYVLGDPAYYHRLGFGCETTVAPPYPLPPDWAGAWQSQALHPDRPIPAGSLRLPDPWMQPALWQP